MADNLLEAMTARCGTCGAALEITWCAAWQAYLCMMCRISRSDAETRVTLAAKEAMQAAAEEAA